jgi:hypothetical protein
VGKAATGTAVLISPEISVVIPSARVLLADIPIAAVALGICDTPTIECHSSVTYDWLLIEPIGINIPTSLAVFCEVVCSKVLVGPAGRNIANIGFGVWTAAVIHVIWVTGACRGIVFVSAGTAQVGCVKVIVIKGSTLFSVVTHPIPSARFSIGTDKVTIIVVVPAAFDFEFIV